MTITPELVIYHCSKVEQYQSESYSEVRFYSNNKLVCTVVCHHMDRNSKMEINEVPD